MGKINPVVHFEMPYDNRERMAKFYQSAFGWQTQMLGEEMGHYVLATTTETDGCSPKQPGGINGGFFPKRPDWPAQHPSIVIAVDGIQAAVRQVSEAGGKVLGEPMEITGVGQYVSFFDTEGNRVSMLQPVPRNSRRTSLRPCTRSPPACDLTAELRKRRASMSPSSRTRGQDQPLRRGRLRNPPGSAQTVEFASLR